MEQLHPPYSITQPRVLNRWLDVNSQNGPLQRCNTYFTIPAFSITPTWLGYSDIIEAFAFSSPNNFTIINPSIFSSIDDYFICISYVEADLSVVRYALNDVPSTILFEVEAYDHQLIKKNFRIEIWSKSATAIVATAVTMYTSVRTNKDTRFGTDQSLATGTVNTDFVSTLDLPFVFDNTITTN